MSNLMSNLSALRGKYNEFLHRCKTIHLKNARKLFFFQPKDQLLGKIDEQAKLERCTKGGESKDAKLCLSYLAPSSHTRETRARVNGCRQSYARGS